MKLNGAECQTPYIINTVHVSVGDALSVSPGSFSRRCRLAPRMPLLSIIQNSTSDPISGVTIIGSSEKNITGPLIRPGIALTPSAMKNPTMMTNGVTMKV